MTDAVRMTSGKDVFQRCYEYTRPDEFRALGLYPYFTSFGGAIAENSPYYRLDGKPVLMFGSNDYLGLTTNPAVKEAAIAAVRDYGTGCSGSRMLNGTLDIHIRLEEELAEFTGKEATVLYSTGFMTNGSLSCLLGRDEYAILDKSVHASINYGTMVSFGKNHRRFRHNDMKDLENIFESIHADRGKIVIVDGVFSMEGDVAPVPELSALCRRHNARLYVDDAHGIGVLGERGAGTAEYFQMLPEVDILMCTFSKSFASTGGFIASERPVIEFLKHHSLPFIYSASMPPAAVATALAALHIFRSEPERREKLLRNSDKIRKGLKSVGFEVHDGFTPIIPVIIDDELLLCRFFKALIEAGIYTNPIFRPAADKGMIRISCMATHEDEHIDQLINTMLEIGRSFQFLQ
ncbi:MAG: pyridoxal phosphate-dependent aminotransferase family protein [Acidobacteria bacterium]|nr:pyridoxal phosphate-dependent aminotransferase family protein [Acidobacteriota bacterium]